MGVESGKVTGGEVKANRDATKQERLLQVELTDPQDIQTIELMSHTGEESNPPDGSKVIVVNVGEAYKLAIASSDGVVPSADVGEKKIYSTDATGATVMAQVHLKNDGTILVSNDAASITVSPAGDVTLVADGDMVATITGDVITGATSVQLNGNGDNLTMWSALNTALQGIITALNGHTHGSGPSPDQTFSLDITNARADTLQTDG